MAPDLFPAIKLIVDSTRQPGRLLLTGSANVLTLPRLSESLAGRMEVLPLFPFSAGELEGTRKRFLARLFDGSAAKARPSSRSEGLASRLPHTTITRYLVLLETVFQVHRLPAWSSNLGRRLVKAPKLHLVDSGLACHLVGADARRLKGDRSLLGRLLETFVVSELRKQISWTDPRTGLYHFRTAASSEVDAVLARADGTVAGIEVKARATAGPDDSQRSGLCGTNAAAGSGPAWCCTPASRWYRPGTDSGSCRCRCCGPQDAARCAPLMQREPGRLASRSAPLDPHRPGAQRGYHDTAVRGGLRGFARHHRDTRGLRRRAHRDRRES